MRKTIGDYIVLIISIIGSFASIWAIGEYFVPELDRQGVVGVLFLGTIAIFFLSYNFYLILKYRKKVRYPTVFEELNVGFAALHRVDRLENVSTEDEIKFILERLIDLCDSIASSFSIVNGHHIGVCLKFLSDEKDRPIVQTLVRDRKSSTKNRKSGNKDNIKHWLDANSDFNFIYSNYEDDNVDTSHYLGINLPMQRDYKNTRLTSWPPKVKLFPFNWIIRQKEWPLKYRCTLVLPIVSIDANVQSQEAIRGFICIDSPRRSAFYKDVDIEILKGISDGLYNKIDRLKVLMTSKTKPTTAKKINQ